jgi:hypothetical protein
MRIECNLILTFKNRSLIILRHIEKDVNKYISSSIYFITIRLIVRNRITKYLYKPNRLFEAIYRGGYALK